MPTKRSKGNLNSRKLNIPDPTVEPASQPTAARKPVKRASAQQQGATRSALAKRAAAAAQAAKADQRRAEEAAAQRAAQKAALRQEEILQEALLEGDSAPRQESAPGSTSSQRRTSGATGTQRRAGATSSTGRVAGATASQRRATSSQRRVPGSTGTVGAAQKSARNARVQGTGAAPAVGGAAAATGRQRPLEATGQSKAAKKPTARSAQKKPAQSHRKAAAAQKQAGATGTAKKAPAPKAQGKAAAPGKQIQKKPGGKPTARTGQGTSSYRNAQRRAQASGFFFSHLKFTLPIAAAIVLFLLLGVADFGMNIGKVHPGVTVQGVDVGGLTVEEASAKIKEELTPQLDEATLMMYANTSKAKLDGVDLADPDTSGGVEKAYADEETSQMDIDGDGDPDKWKIKAETIGMFIDGDALAQEAYAVGRGLDFFPARLGAWFGMSHLDATVSYSTELYGNLAAEIKKEIGRKIVDAKAKVKGGLATVKEGHTGLSMDQAQFTERVSEALFKRESRSFAAPMVEDAQHITPETAQRVADQINASISQVLTITYQDETWKLNSTKLGKFVSQKILEPGEVLQVGDGTAKVVNASDDVQAVYDVSPGTDAGSSWVLQPYVNQKKLDAYLVEQLGDKATGGAKNASFYVKNGKIKIKKSKTGTGPDRKACELAVQNTLFGDTPGNRALVLEDTTIEPAITTEDAEAMGVKEPLSTWAIGLNGSDSRIHNIRLLCKLINKSLVAPGETWSFNGTTGERTDDKGFQTAPVIIGGRHEDQLGGGVCQVATCVFNCACYAGLGIATRSNHEFYIPNYDDTGFADATVNWEEPDLAWVNDTEHYILITAGIDEGDVRVTFWGTDEGRTVTCDRGEWKKGEKARTVRESDPELPKGEEQPVQQGVDGRSINIRYIAKDKNGNTLHDIKFHSIYSAQNEIIKVGTKTGSDSSGDDSA